MVEGGCEEGKAAVTVRQSKNACVYINYYNCLRGVVTGVLLLLFFLQINPNMGRLVVRGNNNPSGDGSGFSVVYSLLKGRAPKCITHLTLFRNGLWMDRWMDVYWFGYNWSLTDESANPSRLSWPAGVTECVVVVGVVCRDEGGGGVSWLTG